MWQAAFWHLSVIRERERRMAQGRFGRNRQSRPSL